MYSNYKLHIEVKQDQAIFLQPRVRNLKFIFEGDIGNISLHCLIIHDVQNLVLPRFFYFLH